MLLIFLLLTASCLAQTDVIYISPSGVDSPSCTASSPCATLKQAVAVARSVETQPATIVLLKGIYSVVQNSDVLLAQDQQVYITSQDGPAKTLVLCSDPTANGISFTGVMATSTDAHNSTVSGITFQGCNTALSFSSTNVRYNRVTPVVVPHVVENCVFRSNTKGILAVSQAKVSIKSCSFTSNINGVTISINADRSYPQSDGLIDIQTAKFTSGQGPDILIPANSPYSLKVFDVSFVGGTETAIQSDDNSITMSQVSVSGYSGPAALLLTSCSLDWSQGSCKNNAGGCLSAKGQGSSLTSLTNVRFSGNQGEQGAAIETSLKLKAIGCSFVGNSGNLGGAIHTSESADFVSCLFDSNNATVSGGAIYLTSTSAAAITLNGGQMRKNTANTGGGIMCNGTLTNVAIQDVTFTSNEGYDGAPFFCGSGCTFTLLSSTLAKNRAQSGALGQCSGSCIFMPSGNSIGTGSDQNINQGPKGDCSWAPN